MADFIIADDEQFYRHLLRRFLEDEGHTVREAENGVVAMELIREREPDVLVTDILMPEKEGLELIIELRRTGCHCRIIAISGGINTFSGSFSYLNTACRLGAGEALTKPFSKESFLKAVHGILDAGSGAPMAVSC